MDDVVGPVPEDGLTCEDDQVGDNRSVAELKHLFSMHLHAAKMQLLCSVLQHAGFEW